MQLFFSISASSKEYLKELLLSDFKTLPDGLHDNYIIRNPDSLIIR